MDWSSAEGTLVERAGVREGVSSSTPGRGLRRGLDPSPENLVI